MTSRTYTYGANKQPPLGRTASGSEGPKIVPPSVKERRRMAAWLRERASDKKCMLNVKFTPKDNL